MQTSKDTPKETQPQQTTDEGLDDAICSPSSDSSVGKSFTMIGFGGPRLRERVKAEGLVLWSVSKAKGHPDEFTHGWSGCDPGQLYFVENAKHIHPEPTTKDNANQ
jgi:hypothetical protein